VCIFFLTIKSPARTALLPHYYRTITALFVSRSTEVSQYDLAALLLITHSLPKKKRSPTDFSCIYQKKAVSLQAI
jgi:hypothetical protein